MSLATSLVIALAATILLSAALFACTRHTDSAQRPWIIKLACTIATIRLRHLPAQQLERYREEYEADLDHLHETPRAALMHALQSAAGAGRLARMLEGAAPRPRDPVGRRALAHLGFPVRLNDIRDDADASYIFDGTMRNRR